jgi:hypothetical protein
MSEAIFGFIGVIVGAVIPWLQTSFRERKNIQNDANYLAIKVITILEKYVLDCVDVVCDDGTSMGQPAGRDGCYEHQVETPAHIIFTDDVSWKSIDVKLMFKLLSLANIAHEADRSISFCIELASPPDYEEFFEERQKKYAEIGLYALKVKTEIRQKYKIPKRAENEDWSPDKIFIERLEKIEQCQKKRHVVFEKMGKV